MLLPIRRHSQAGTTEEDLDERVDLIPRRASRCRLEKLFCFASNPSTNLKSNLLPLPQLSHTRNDNAGRLGAPRLYIRPALKNSFSRAVSRGRKRSSRILGKRRQQGSMKYHPQKGQDEQCKISNRVESSWELPCGAAGRDEHVWSKENGLIIHLTLKKQFDKGNFIIISAPESPSEAAASPRKDTASSFGETSRRSQRGLKL